MSDAGARLLEGAPIASEIRTAVSRGRRRPSRPSTGRPPGLAVVIVGRDAPSTVYLEQILRGCAKVGIDGPGSSSSRARRPRRRWSRPSTRSTPTPTVDGVIVQMPLPADDPAARRSSTRSTRPRTSTASTRSTPDSSAWATTGFLPATAHAAVEILRRSGIEIAGRDAVVVGRSAVVGMPAAFLLVQEDATVTVCHSRTRDLAAHVGRADIVVVAAGHPGLITGAMLKPGAVVVDVGINLVDGRIVGDVDFASAIGVASAITPVPGGVGPLTNALLLTHLIRAAERPGDRAAAPRPPRFRGDR